MIYLYAICDGVPERLDEISGLAGAPLLTLRHGSLAAVYSADPPREMTPTEDSLWCHERVVEQVMAERTVLPLRFGSTLSSELELRELLMARAGEFIAALAGVRGRVELGVRAVATVSEDPDVSPTSSGRAYVTAKLERRRAAARLGEELHSELASLAHASTFHLVAEPHPTFAGSYLVDRARIEDFRRGVDKARAARPSVEVACTGPWPPFSFTEPLEAA